MAAATNNLVYQLHITLRETRPPIWRRIQVSEDISLTRLHRAIQISMGWEDRHLHEFEIDGRHYGVPDADDQLYGREVLDENQSRLGEVVQLVGTRFMYWYDFGDNWRHDVLLEGILLPEPDASYPRCIGGERCAPPEDVSGTHGFERYLEAMADPEHPHHEEVMTWRGPFDPLAFSTDAVNRQLAKRFGLSRKVGIALVPPAAKQIRRVDKIPLVLTERERELILVESFVPENLLGPLRRTPRTGTPTFRFTRDDLDEMAGYIAAEANHARTKKLEKEWTRLYRRIEEVLQSYKVSERPAGRPRPRRDSKRS